MLGKDAMSLNVSEGDLLIIRFGDFRLDFGLRCAYRGTEKLKIPRIPFSTLEFLVQNRHRVVSKAELLEAVWGGDRDVSTVEHAVSQLRRTLQSDEAGVNYIETVPGYGYRFVAEVVPPTSGADEVELPSPASPIPVADVRSASAWEWLLPHPRRMSWLWIAVVLLACGATAAVLAYLLRPMQISSVTASGNALIAKGITGNAIWTYQFDTPFMERPVEELKWRIQVVDLNGDGHAQVLAAAAFANPAVGHGGSEELFCFSSRGKLLWRYRPETDMEFNARDLNGPWVFHAMLVVDDGKSKSVWVAVGHQIWWPAFIVKVSPDGTPETVFSSSGIIDSLLSVRTKSGTYVLAGGINNEYRMASVAILASDAVPATSPQSDGSKYQCIRGCPGGRPYRYILLPRSEVNSTSELPYNNVSGMDNGPHGVTIQTAEILAASQFFDFSEEFQPERVIFSSDYPEFHRRFEKEGRIAHTFDRCPEARSPAVVRIFDENGASRLVSVPRVQ